MLSHSRPLSSSSKHSESNAEIPNSSSQTSPNWLHRCPFLPHPARGLWHSLIDVGLISKITLICFFFLNQVQDDNTIQGFPLPPFRPRRSTACVIARCVGHASVHCDSGLCAWGLARVRVVPSVLCFTAGSIQFTSSARRKATMLPRILNSSAQQSAHRRWCARGALWYWPSPSWYQLQAILLRI